MLGSGGRGAALLQASTSLPTAPRAACVRATGRPAGTLPAAPQWGCLAHGGFGNHLRRATSALACSTPHSGAPAGRALKLRCAAASGAALGPSEPAQQPAPGPLAPLRALLSNGRWRTTVNLAATLLLWAGLASLTGGASSGRFASATAASSNGLSTEAARVAVSSAWAGLAAGCLHTLAGADHLAALTPLTIGVSHLKASFLGALWGFGHSMGQLTLGLAMVLLKDRFTELVPTISRFGGATVGGILVAIGLVGLFEGLHGHDHDHDHGHGHEHGGAEGGAAAALLKAKDKDGSRFKLATFATGVVYGLHPDALFVVIPALTLPTKAAAAAYILMFVLGTITAMGGYTAVIGATSKAIEERNAWLASKLSSLASLLALCVGGAILAGEFGLSVPVHLHLFGGHAH